MRCSAGRAAPLESPDWSGPALYAVQCGLTALWSSVGIRPKATTARDAGALAAAQAAGSLGLEDGLRLAAAGEGPPGAGSANPEPSGGSGIVMEIGPGVAGGFAAAVAEAYEAGLDIDLRGAVRRGNEAAHRAARLSLRAPALLDPGVAARGLMKSG